MIKAILFDFAGVIGTDGYWVWLKEKVPDLEKKRYYFQTLSEKIDLGSITNQEFIEGVAKGVNLPGGIIWKEIFKKIVINTELLGLISLLRKKYRIGLLTNYNYKWMNELLELYKLNKYFDVKVISSLCKMIKPDKEIYLKTLNFLKIKEEEALFFDDRQKNVDGGENAGIKSFIFTTNQQFKEDLKNCGITL